MTYDAAKLLETERALKASEEKGLEERGREKAKESIKFEKLDRLTKNEDFQWFVAEYWAPMLKEEHDEALNVSKTPEQRNNHTQQHHAINEMLIILQREHKRLHTILSTP
jgi:hypothetical protein